MSAKGLDPYSKVFYFMTSESLNLFLPVLTTNLLILFKYEICESSANVNTVFPEAAFTSATPYSVFSQQFALQ